MKVGDYIHYKFSNYRANGVSVYDGKAANPTQVFKNQKNAILQSLPKRSSANKSTIKATLEQQLNFFFDPTAKGTINTGYTAQEITDIQKMIISMCQSAISGLSSASVNYDSLSVIGGAGTLSAEIADLDKLTRRFASEGKNTNRGAIYRKLQALINHRDTLLSSSNANDKAFINAVNQLQTEYNSLIADIESRLSRDASGNIMVATGYGSHKGIKTGGTFKFDGNTNGISHQNFIQRIQALLEMSKKTTNGNLQGALGEFVPAASQYIYKMTLQKGVQDCLADLGSNMSYHIDVIKGSITGDVRSRKAIDSSKVLSKRGSGIETTIGDIKVSTGATQDKVDIVVDIPDNQTINASVKNYNLGKHGSIGILKGTSSLKYLQQYPYFTNHYLNITANIGRDDPAPSSLIQQAHDMAKMTLVLHALTGSVWGQQSDGSFGKSAQAEILIVNDTSGKQHFKVYFMSDILDRIVKNIDLATIKGFTSNYANYWVSDYNKGKEHLNRQCAYRRAANVLAQLHSQKLEVSIDVGALI